MSEVASFVLNVSQFEEDESTGECVAFTAAQIISMRAPNVANPSAVEDIDQLADTIYQNVTGQLIDPIPISVDQLKRVLYDYRVRFAEINTDTDSIDAALSSGCPVIVQGAESGFRYPSGQSPYSWDTDDINHCIIVSGIANVNGYEVCDSANGHAYFPVYSKSMDLFSAIKVVPTWIGGVMIPDGWTDDGSTLTAPNGHKVVMGFRSYILNNPWDPDNYPLEEEHGQSPVEVSNPSLGGGTQQIFRFTALEWTAANGVFVGSIGQELLAVRKTSKTSDAEVQDLITKLKQIAAITQGY